MKYLTKAEFLKKCTGSYWKNQQARWQYIYPVIVMLKTSNAKSVLELGNMGVSLTDSSDTMDVCNWYDNDLTYHIDATKTPWNIPDKKYDFFIALQVFEHLDDNREKQVDVFNEACRVSKNVIISIPYKWKFKKFHNHKGIDDFLVRKWASNRIETKSILISTGNHKRKIYWWKI